MKHMIPLLLCGVLPLATLAQASPSVSQEKESSQVVTTTLQALEQQQMKQQAQAWGLSVEEWERYEQLKQGRRGLLSPGLDPLTMLGIEARTDEERRHYAELTVKQDYQRVEAELAFQREVNDAWPRLFPGILPVQDDESRLALFVRAECPPCDRKLTQLLATNRPLDIYLVGSGGKDEAVRAWAKKHNIPADKVKSRRITLNHDGGKWLKYGNGLMPVVLQQEGNGWQPAN